MAMVFGWTDEFCVINASSQALIPDLDVWKAHLLGLIMMSLGPLGTG